jgi:hypothetical protein
MPPASDNGATQQKLDAILLRLDAQSEEIAELKRQVSNLQLLGLQIQKAV